MRLSTYFLLSFIYYFRVVTCTLTRNMIKDIHAYRFTNLSNQQQGCESTAYNEQTHVKLGK